MLIPGPIDAVTVHVDTYLTVPEKFELRARNPRVGFTRAELVISITGMYQYVYRVEEETMGMGEAPYVSLNRGYTLGKVSPISENELSALADLPTVPNLRAQPWRSDSPHRLLQPREALHDSRHGLVKPEVSAESLLLFIRPDTHRFATRDDTRCKIKSRVPQTGGVEWRKRHQPATWLSPSYRRTVSCSEVPQPMTWSLLAEVDWRVEFAANETEQTR